MLITHVHQFLTNPGGKISKRQVVFWFSLSLTFALIYGILGLQQAFAGEYVVQDDARQHVFWMQRFVDSTLFPNDLIADYFQSVAPPGYTALYQLMAVGGINPMLFNKFLPLVLLLITTGYFFGVCLEMFPVPAAGFIATLLLNQNLWISDDVSSGTPRAFLYPLLGAFFYYLLRRSWLPCLVIIFLQGLFYPPCILIAAAVLLLQPLRWENRRIKFSRQKKDYWFVAAGLGVSLLMLLPYALIDSQFSPTIELAQAKTMAEFLPGGRTSFFSDDPWKFWFNGERSGMFPKTILTPATLSVGLLLPILLQFTAQLPLVKKVKSEAIFLVQLIVASFGLFFAAHAVLFTLYLPSRYTHHSLKIVIALAAAIAITILLDGLFHWAKQHNQPPKQQIVALGITGLVGIALIMYPRFLEDFPDLNYKVGQAPALYKFFAQQPKNGLIASLTEEADNLPSFSGRSVLVSREHAIPYHTGYYQPFRQRAIDLIKAQYSPNIVEVKKFIEKYNINFLLLDRAAFTPEYVDNHRWLRQFQPEAQEAQNGLKQGSIPALAGLMNTCSVFEQDHLVVLEAECIINGISK
ncbi:hypothetical protein [Lyngbya aestuarii]|uniref:hypothetical protein n=1 Tax=Lyngbya aestuarii TaxID=118322 RepID=UPI00403D8753